MRCVLRRQEQCVDYDTVIDTGIDTGIDRAQENGAHREAGGSASRDELAVLRVFVQVVPNGADGALCGRACLHGAIIHVLVIVLGAARETGKEPADLVEYRCTQTRS